MSHSKSTVPAVAAALVPGPFVKILHGNKAELYANLNCSMVSFLRYLQLETGLPEKQLDLCSDKGVVVDLQCFYSPEEAREESDGDSLENILKARGTFILLKVIFIVVSLLLTRLRLLMVTRLAHSQKVQRNRLLLQMSSKHDTILC